MFKFLLIEAQISLCLTDSILKVELASKEGALSLWQSTLIQLLRGHSSCSIAILACMRMLWTREKLGLKLSYLFDFSSFAEFDECFLFSGTALILQLCFLSSELLEPGIQSISFGLGLIQAACQVLVTLRQGDNLACNGTFLISQALQV